MDVNLLYHFNFMRKEGKNHRIASTRCVGKAHTRFRFHFVDGITEMKVVKHNIILAIPKAAKTTISSQIYLFFFFLSNSVNPNTNRKINEITTAGEVIEKSCRTAGASKST